MPTCWFCETQKTDQFLAVPVIGRQKALMPDRWQYSEEIQHDEDHNLVLEPDKVYTIQVPYCTRCRHMHIRRDILVAALGIITYVVVLGLFVLGSSGFYAIFGFLLGFVPPAIVMILVSKYLPSRIKPRQAWTEYPPLKVLFDTGDWHKYIGQQGHSKRKRKKNGG
jgi:hypothetical protein